MKVKIQDLNTVVLTLFVGPFDEVFAFLLASFIVTTPITITEHLSNSSGITTALHYLIVVDALPKTRANQAATGIVTTLACEKECEQ